jgi:transposase InsO family protein
MTTVSPSRETPSSITPLTAGKNRKIKRFFGTLKQSLDCWQIPDALVLQRSLNQFLFFYNHIRPHENLDGQTPVEAWEGG